MKNSFRRLAAAALAVAVIGLVPAVSVQAAEKPAAATAATAADRIDLNTATADQLTELPGIGQALAQRIVDYREDVGSFGAVEELMNVKGIGEKSFAKLAPRLKVSARKSDASH